MALLDLLKQVKEKVLKFENHPCNELDEEIKIHYLNGLALLANEDSESEKADEYLAIMNNSFGFSGDMLEVFKDFATNPDEQAILDMIQSFETKDIKYNFIIDAMMIAGIDDNFCDNKKAVISEFCEMFKITKKETEDLEKIYEMFYVQNGNALYRYFKRNEYMKVELFQYLLDYYKIDMAYELLEDEKKILTFEFFKPTFEYGGLGNNAKEIMTKPVSNIQVCIYLNACINKSIEFNGTGKVVDSESKYLLIDLDNSDIGFNDDIFYLKNRGKDNEKITGITAEFVKLFVKWISSLYNEQLKIVQLYADSSSDCSIIIVDKIHSIKNEFYIYRKEFQIIPNQTKRYFKVYSSPERDLETSFRLMR